ncbi:hypothetical protein AMAG_07483 [Allomyces macrogynus ATCC 38327]|uniref:Uncharacterized protein n=1 Tax=Allomyces macrogynus (strain ATCC 38327) TaxID=578462 RepID=A0A0L0SIS6_ALLM3|nr:hypothetical protein AMAG_07483 [Allomyces macrogynus ATCC 38327]|eukprot:KNE62245.1 hypothetical protein AMAG_07483 [Allomyces macrogynus ATCC 38327]
MTILAPGTPLAGLLILAAPPNPANHDPAILVADPVTIKLLDTDVFPKALLQETTLPVKFRRGADATVQLLHDSVASAGVGPNGISFRSLLVATHPSSSSAAAPRFLIYGLLHNSTSLTLHAASLISLDALVHRAPALPYHLPPTPIIPTSSGLASDAIAYLSSLAPRAPSRAVHSNPRLQAILGNPTAVQEPVRRRGGAADGRARRAHTVVSDGPASDASSSTTATVESSGVGRSGKSATRGNLDVRDFGWSRTRMCCALTIDRSCSGSNWRSSADCSGTGSTRSTRSTCSCLGSCIAGASCFCLTRSTKASSTRTCSPESQTASWSGTRS